MALWGWEGTSRVWQWTDRGHRFSVLPIYALKNNKREYGTIYGGGLA